MKRTLLSRRSQLTPRRYTVFFGDFLARGLRAAVGGGVGRFLPEGSLGTAFVRAAFVAVAFLGGEPLALVFDATRLTVAGFVDFVGSCSIASEAAGSAAGSPAKSIPKSALKSSPSSALWAAGASVWSTPTESNSAGSTPRNRKNKAGSASNFTPTPYKTAPECLHRLA